MKFLSILFVVLSSPVQATSALAVKQIARGIYVHFGVHELPDRHNHGAIANIGFIVGNDCVAVIDTGGNPEEGEALKLAIKKVTSLPVCYVINSHVHPDHIYGNKAFKNAQTQFVGHYKLQRAMAMRSDFYLNRAAEQLGVELTPEDLIPPDIQVHKQLQLDLGGRKITVVAHPTAHTDNDISVFDAQTKTLWLADLLFLEHIPVVDGSVNGWIKELEQLANRKFKYVIPGHGPLVTDWPQGMAAIMDYLQMLRKEIRQAIKQGVYMEDAMNTVGKSAQQNWRLYDQFHKKNISTAYAELEWED